MRLLLVLALMAPFQALSAEDQPGPAVAAGDPLSSEEVERADVRPLELDPIEVTGEWSFEQEVTLRVLRRALESERSERKEDIDKWVCWFEEKTGSHLTYLNCARNGDLWALRPQDVPGRGVVQSNPNRRAGYGTIMRSTRPANRRKVMRALERMPGSAEFDQEFLALAANGARPPRDIPDDAELDRFASALQSVNALAAEGADDDRLESAIAAAGLSLKRYNRIASLVKTYQSIENEVAIRLQR